MHFSLILLYIAFLLNISTSLCSAAGHIEKWSGQTVYVPLYSQIYAEDRFKDKPFNLTATLSIRNTDPDHGLRLTAVDYYDSAGKKLRSFVQKPVAMQPLGSIHYIVPESDTRGGLGAKFLVHWDAEHGITEPIIESIMIGTQLQQGISFISRGRVIGGKIED